MQMKEMLVAELDRQGVDDPVLRAGLAAIIGGESDFKPQSEASYAHTENKRLRVLFGSRLGMFSNAVLSDLKANDEEFFNVIYGGEWGREHLGNTLPGDGWNFRGRGLIQLTGRANYERYGSLSGHSEIVTNPDLANDPAIAVALAVAYVKDRYHGGGWAALKRAVGVSIGAPDQRKDELYVKYLASGEFDPGRKSSPDDIGALIVKFNGAVIALQQGLKTLGFYTGVVDGDWGPMSREALMKYRKRN